MVDWVIIYLEKHINFGAKKKEQLIDVIRINKWISAIFCIWPSLRGRSQHLSFCTTISKDWFSCRLSGIDILFLHLWSRSWIMIDCWWLGIFPSLPLETEKCRINLKLLIYFIWSSSDLIFGQIILPASRFYISFC